VSYRPSNDRSVSVLIQIPTPLFSNAFYKDRERERERECVLGGVQNCGSPYPSWLCCAFVITTHVYISWGSMSRYVTFKLQKQSESLVKIRPFAEDFQYAVFYGIYN
jgi:hypothetical protein